MLQESHSSLLPGSTSFLCAAVRSLQRAKQYCSQIEWHTEHILFFCRMHFATHCVVVFSEVRCTCTVHVLCFITLKVFAFGLLVRTWLFSSTKSPMLLLCSSNPRNPQCCCSVQHTPPLPCMCSCTLAHAIINWKRKHKKISNRPTDPSRGEIVTGIRTILYCGLRSVPKNYTRLQILPGTSSYRTSQATLASRQDRIPSSIACT